MPSQDELFDKLADLQKAKAKRLACLDVAEFLEKQDKKLERQINELIRKYERMKKSGKRDDVWTQTFDQMQTLKYQMMEIIALQTEFLTRSTDAGKAWEKAEDEFEEIAKRYKDEK